MLLGDWLEANGLPGGLLGTILDHSEWHVEDFVECFRDRQRLSVLIFQINASSNEAVHFRIPLFAAFAGAGLPVDPALYDLTAIAKAAITKANAAAAAATCVTRTIAGWKDDPKTLTHGFRLGVLFCGGQEMLVEVCLLTSVKQIKCMIQKTTGVPWYSQVLWKGSTELNSPYSRLCECGISSDAYQPTTVQLIVDSDWADRTQLLHFENIYDQEYIPNFPPGCSTFFFS
jgi:hypothetical protein